MCSVPNLASLPSWNLAKPTPSAPSNCAVPRFCYDTKPKHFNYRMLLLNNLNKQEDVECNDCMQSKYFLSPLRTFQLTPEECNEILIKRASLAAEGSSQTVSGNDSLNNSRGINSQNSVVNNNNNSNNNNNNHNHNSNNSLQGQGSNCKLSLEFSHGAKLRPYSCMECGKTFIQKHHLTTHKKVHSGIRPYTCVHCGKAFTHKHCLNTHLLLHSSSRPYECTECKKSFTLKHHLISHAKVHNRAKPFICTDCGCAFPLKRHLVTHAKYHAGERPFLCEECGESFAQKDHLVMHSRFHGSTNSFACHECGLTFTRKFELVNHSRLHGHVPLSCPICNKEFLQKRTLVVHMRVHNSDSPFNCPTCGESFHHRTELGHHMSTHNGLPPSTHGKLLSCSECGSSFTNPEALALHIKLHSGDASFINDLCTLTANLQGSNFLMHNNQKGNPNGSNIKQENSSAGAAGKVKAHLCKFCAKAFTARHGLQQHNKRHPEGTCTLKTHVCDTCGKAFYQKNHLLLHQRQHMDLSGRNSNYLKSDRQPSSPGDFYNRSPSNGNLLEIGSKISAGDETTDNVDDLDFSTDKGSYLPPVYDGYCQTKFKGGHGRLPEREKDVYGKNHFLDSLGHYSHESVSSVDVKMQISEEVGEGSLHPKVANANFAVIRQAVV